MDFVSIILLLERYTFFNRLSTILIYELSKKKNIKRGDPRFNRQYRLKAYFPEVSKNLDYYY